MKFHKYEALGNDYIVLERDSLPGLTADRIRRLCDRHRGIGSDGVLIEGASTEAGELQLRIFNVDGSEAERSGNGLRIFARSLWDAGRVGADAFPVHTIAGASRCRSVQPPN